jgi:hypothetical protein
MSFSDRPTTNITAEKASASVRYSVPNTVEYGH